MGQRVGELPRKAVCIALRNGHLKGIVEGLPVSQIRCQRRRQVRIVAMAQRRFKRVFLGFPGEVIAARAKVSALRIMPCAISRSTLRLYSIAYGNFGL